MADSILRLRVEDKEYNASLKQARQGLLALQQALQQSGATFQHVDKATVEYARGLGRMETTAKTAKGRIGEMTSAFTDLRMQYKQLSDAEKNSPFGKAMNQSLNELRGRIQETKKQMSDVDNELKAAKVDTTDFSGVIGELGSKLGVSSELMGVLTTGTMGYAAAIGASVTAVIAATKAWVDYNSELAKQTQITTVTTGLSGNNAGDMTSFGRSVASTYGVDFREVINAANTLMQQFGKSGEEAMQIIRDGMQGMVQGDGPKLLSMIQQYAPSFRDAGISAQQLVAIIQNSEGGIFTDQNMNAIVMGIKNLRLMTNATAEALQKVGINSEEMTQKLNDGSITIFDAMRQVSEAIERTGTSSQAAGEVMQQVFGRQGTAAGTNLGKAIATLNTNLDETKRQTGSLGEEFSKLQKSSEDLENAMRECFGFTEIDDLEAKLRTTFNNSLTKVVDGVAKLKTIWEEFENLVGRNVAANAFKLLAARITQMLHPMMLLYNEAAKLFVLFGSDSGRGGNNWFGKVGGSIQSFTDQMVLAAKGEIGGGGGGYVPPAPTTGGGGVGGRGGRGGRGSGGGRGTVTPKEEKIDLKSLFPDEGEIHDAAVSYAEQIRSSITESMAASATSADENAFRNFMQVAIENGMTDLSIDWETLGMQIFSELGIPDEKWEEIQNEFNEKLAAMGKDANLQLDTATGNWKKPKKEKDDKKSDPIGKDVSQIVNSVSSIVSGLNSLGIDVPNGITKMIGVMQLILGITSAIQTILVVMGVKSSIPIIGGMANGGIVGRAAGGMLIPGNSFSGDNLRMPAVGGGVIGVNSGELILNRVQQGVLANALQGNSFDNLELTASLNGEDIVFAIDNASRRRGKGTMVRLRNS